MHFWINQFIVMKDENFINSVNCRFSFSNFRHLINSRFFFCSSTSNDLYNNHFLETLKHRLIKRKIEIIHTSNHLHLIHKSTINIQNIKQKKLNFVSFRICFNDLFVSMIFSEFVTTISEFASMKFLMNRLERFQNVCVRFFTSLQSTLRNELFTHTIREQWHE